jgi:glutamate-1-semialdehyde 2,1-aminomutase
MESAAVQRARADFADRSVESSRLHDAARTVMPGGNTRSLFYLPPFPLTFVKGAGSILTDADGRHYVDMLGDYTAGLLGHAEPQVRAAVNAALENNSSVGGIHPLETTLARSMCARWSLDLVRFTNSGTEANLMAITAARAATKRSTIMVMEGGYHGGVLYFVAGAAPWNAPYPAVLARFNDLEHCRATIADVGDDLAAVLVEPMLGSAGCIPPSPGFLHGLIDAAHQAGALVIFDQVMTSRLGPHGLAELLSTDDAPLQPDLQTFGKYIAGGYSFGAFGGRDQFMQLFDVTRPGSLPHAGTFNNNVASLAAGVEVLDHLYTAEIADRFTRRGDDFRSTIAAVLGRHGLPLCVTGIGTMLNIHTHRHAPTDGRAAVQRNLELQELLYLALLQRGYYVAPRLMINLSLSLTDDHLAGFVEALDDTLGELVA